MHENSNRILLVNRVLNAPVKLVWEVWTNPDHIKNWWGPDGFSNTIYIMDLQPGGRWELTMHGPDGTDYKNKSIFKEIIPCEKIVYEHETGPKFTATILFIAEGNRTRIEWSMLFETAEEKERTVKIFNAEEGLHQNTEKLSVYLYNIHANALVIEKRIHAATEKVWMALTDKSAMQQWYFELDNFRAEPGFEFSFPGKGHKCENYIHRCRILEVIPNQKLTYSWTYENYPGYSEVTFELIPEGAYTLVRLTHTGLETFPQNNPDFARSSFNGGWNELIGKQLPLFAEA